MKIFITILAIAGIALAAVAQESKILCVIKNGEVSYRSAVSEIDSIIFYPPDIRIVNGEGVIINGVLWATRNVDAPGTFTANPEDAGMFYQWNRKIGWSATDPLINTNGDDTWNTGFPFGVNWEKINDPSPAGWRMPTINEFWSLLDNDKVNNEWTTENGINGMKFTDKSTGKTLFLPAAGYRGSDDGALYYAGTQGDYWTSDVKFYLQFYSDHVGWNFGSNNGFSVRPVAEN